MDMRKGVARRGRSRLLNVIVSNSRCRIQGLVEEEKIMIANSTRERFGLICLLSKIEVKNGKRVTEDEETRVNKQLLL